MSIFAKAALSLSPSIDELIVSIPNIKIAKPTRISPIFCFLLLPDDIVIITPITARIGVNDDGFKILTKKLSPFMPERLKIHAVTVVPMFAPIIMLIVCESFIMPEFTNPTSITVVADEL